MSANACCEGLKVAGRIAKARSCDAVRRELTNLVAIPPPQLPFDRRYAHSWLVSAANVLGQ
jgi:hypothetical protein